MLDNTQTNSYIVDFVFSNKKNGTNHLRLENPNYKSNGLKEITFDEFQLDPFGMVIHILDNRKNNIDMMGYRIWDLKNVFFLDLEENPKYRIDYKIKKRMFGKLKVKTFSYGYK